MTPCNAIYVQAFSLWGYYHTHVSPSRLVYLGLGHYLSSITNIHVYLRVVLHYSLHTSSQNDLRSVPLEVAAEEGHTETVKRLLEGGALVNYQSSVSLVFITLLLLCCTHNYCSIAAFPCFV